MVSIPILLLGLTLVVAGSVLSLIAAGLGAATIVPCLRTSDLCTNLSTLITQTYFFGRLPESDLMNMLHLAFFMLTFLAIFLLYAAYRLLVYHIAKDKHLMTINLSIVTTLLLIALTVAVFLASESTLRWLDYIHDGCPEVINEQEQPICADIDLDAPDNLVTVSLDTNPPVNLVVVYNDIIYGTRTILLILTGWVSLLTFWIASNADVPKRVRQTYETQGEKDNILHCQWCGRMGTLPDERPVCVLCKQNIDITGFELDRDTLAESSTTPAVLTFRFQPADRQLAIRYPHIQIHLPQEIQLDRVSLPDGWLPIERSIGNIYNIQGSAFLTERVEITCELRPANHLRQRKRRQSYTITLRVQEHTLTELFPLGKSAVLYIERKDSNVERVLQVIGQGLQQITRYAVRVIRSLIARLMSRASTATFQSHSNQLDQPQSDTQPHPPESTRE